MATYDMVFMIESLVIWGWISVYRRQQEAFTLPYLNHRVSFSQYTPLPIGML